MLFEANPNDPIRRTQLCQNDYFTHLICTANELRVMDERFTARPLLAWKHHLKSACLFLENFNLYDSTNKYTHFAMCSDSMDTFAYQFSTKYGTYVSHNLEL